MYKKIIFLLLFAIVFSPLVAQDAKNGSIGVGIGVPYGAIGFNAEINLLKYLSLSGGLGTTIFAGTAYAFGTRIYVRPTGETWRPRFSAHYGINSIIKLDTHTDGQKFTGLSLGAGIQGMFGERKRSGFDFEVVYLATTGGLDDEIERINQSGNYSHIDSPGKIKLLFGYRFGF